MKRIIVNASDIGNALLAQKRSSKQQLILKLWTQLEAGAETTKLDPFILNRNGGWDVDVTGFTSKVGKLLVRATFSTSVDLMASDLVKDREQRSELATLNHQLLSTWSLKQTLSKLGLAE